MFLLHRRLGGVDGLADAAQLKGKQRRAKGVNLTSRTARFLWLASPPTQP